MGAPRLISVVVPVYGEAGCLGETVRTLSALLEDIQPGDWELVLVNDGSADGTGPLIDELAAGSPHIVGAHHAVNRGKGAAIQTGVGLTRGDLVLFTDADLSTPPDTLRAFLLEIDQGADVVLGNRKSSAATIERSQPWLRVQLGLGFTRLANAVTGMAVTDYTCGFKLFRGDAARRIFAELGTARWCFDVEVLARAVRDDLRIIEIPVRWHHEDDTRVRVARDIVQSLVELFAIRRRLGRVPRGRGGASS